MNTLANAQHKTPCEWIQKSNTSHVHMQGRKEMWLRTHEFSCRLRVVSSRSKSRTARAGIHESKEQCGILCKSTAAPAWVETVVFLCRLLLVSPALLLLHLLHLAPAFCLVSPHCALSLIVPMMLSLREATAMPAMERRACWLAGPLQVQRRLLLLAFACCRGRCSPLRASGGVRATGSARCFLHCGGAGRGCHLLPPPPRPAAFLGRGSTASWRK